MPPSLVEPTVILPLLMLAQAKTASYCAPAMAAFADDPKFALAHARPMPFS